MLAGAQGEAIPVRLPVMHVRCADGAHRPSFPRGVRVFSWRYGKAVLDGPTTEGESYGTVLDADDVRLKI